MLPEGVKALLDQLAEETPDASAFKLFTALQGRADVTLTQVTNWYQRRRRTSNVQPNAAVWLDLQDRVQSSGGDEPPIFNLATAGSAPRGVVVVGKPQLWESRQWPSRSFYDGRLACGIDRRLPRLTNLCARALLRHYQNAHRWLNSVTSYVEARVMDLVSLTHRVQTMVPWWLTQATPPPSPWGGHSSVRIAGSTMSNDSCVTVADMDVSPHRKHVRLRADLMRILASVDAMVAEAMIYVNMVSVWRLPSTLELPTHSHMAVRLRAVQQHVALCLRATLVACRTYVHTCSQAAEMYSVGAGLLSVVVLAAAGGGCLPTTGVSSRFPCPPIANPTLSAGSSRLHQLSSPAHSVSEPDGPVAALDVPVEHKPTLGQVSAFGAAPATGASGVQNSSTSLPIASVPRRKRRCRLSTVSTECADATMAVEAGALAVEAEEGKVGRRYPQLAWFMYLLRLFASSPLSSRAHTTLLVYCFIVCVCDAAAGFRRVTLLSCWCAHRLPARPVCVSSSTAHPGELTH